MTRDELFKLASRCYYDTATANEQMIQDEINEAFGANRDNTQISLSDAIAHSTALALSLTPRLAAATTMRILIELGLVTPDDESAE